MSRGSYDFLPSPLALNPSNGIANGKLEIADGLEMADGIAFKKIDEGNEDGVLEEYAKDVDKEPPKPSDDVSGNKDTGDNGEEEDNQPEGGEEVEVSEDEGKESEGEEAGVENPPNDGDAMDKVKVEDKSGESGGGDTGPAEKGETEQPLLEVKDVEKGASPDQEEPKMSNSRFYKLIIACFIILVICISIIAAVWPKLTNDQDAAPGAKSAETWTQDPSFNIAGSTRPPIISESSTRADYDELENSSFRDEVTRNSELPPNAGNDYSSGTTAAKAPDQDTTPVAKSDTGTQDPSLSIAGSPGSTVISETSTTIGSDEMENSSGKTEDPSSFRDEVSRNRTLPPSAGNDNLNDTSTPKPPKNTNNVRESYRIPDIADENLPTVVVKAAETTNPDSDVESFPSKGANGSTIEKSGKIMSEPMNDAVTEAIEKERVECRNRTIFHSFMPRTFALMNKEANPCEDFYAYACGGMEGESSQSMSKVDPDSEILSRISRMVKGVDAGSHEGLKAYKNFIDSCENYRNVPMATRIEKAREILSTIGQMYTEEGWYGEDREINYLTKLIGSLLSHNFSPLLDVLLDVDSQDSSKFVLKLTLPLHQSPFRDIDMDDNGMEPEGKSCKMKKKMGDYGEALYGINHKYNKCQDSSYISEVEGAVKALKIFNNECDEQKFLSDFECEVLRNVTEILPSPTERERIIRDREFKVMTLRDLQREFSFVHWAELMTNLTKVNLSDNTTVQVYFESYFKSLSDLVLFWDQWSLSNALIAMFVHDLYHGLVLDHNEFSRHKYCLNVARHLMRDETSALYIKSYSPERFSMFQTKIKSTFEALNFTLAHEISNDKWLNDSTLKDIALEKVKTMKLIADGGVSTFRNDSYLDNRIIGYNMNSTYIENAVSLLQRLRKNMYLMYEKNPSEPEQIWSLFLDPYSTTGLALHSLNTIVIPYGIMQQPFFNELFLSYFQMGRLGHLIAKEMHKLLKGTVGIKDRHLTFGSETWRNCHHDKHIGSVHADDLQDDYAATYLAYKSIWGNDIGDETGVSCHLVPETPQQLYFLAMAQNLCTKTSMNDYTESFFKDEPLPPVIRVNAITRHSKDFQDAFNCAPKDVNGHGCGVHAIAIPKDLSKEPQVPEKVGQRCTSQKTNLKCYRPETTTPATTTLEPETDTTNVPEVTTTMEIITAKRVTEMYTATTEQTTDYEIYTA